METDHEIYSMAIVPLLLIQKDPLSVTAVCALSSGQWFRSKLAKEQGALDDQLNMTLTG